jgi:hypothetical protein
MARMARIISRMRAAGLDHGIEKRFVMCGLIWLPSPRMNRPCAAACRSHDTWASVMGLRAKATTMPVARSSRSVCSAARISGRNGSWLVSGTQMPS